MVDSLQKDVPIRAASTEGRAQYKARDFAHGIGSACSSP